MLKINTKAPNFKLPSTSKEDYALKDSIGKYVIIYFYPKDDTPGCTIETNDFNKLLSKFKKLDCEVFGVSKDNLKSHDKNILENNEIKAKIASIIQSVQNEARIIVRPSGTEKIIRIMVESNNKELIKTTINRVENLLMDY